VFNFGLHLLVDDNFMSNNDLKVKHLEFIQNVITRMNSNSFMIKGWTITIVAALLALSANASSNFPSCFFVYIASLVIIVFWVLDAFYLSQERQYRSLFDEVRNRDNTDFSMNASGFNSGSNTWISAICSKTILVFFGLLSLLVYLLTVILIKG